MENQDLNEESPFPNASSAKVEKPALFCFIYLFIFVFLGPHLWHMEVPRLGV